jgi:hypothetical protein
MELKDLSDYTDVSIAPLLFFSILTVDVAVLFLTRYFPELLGMPLNDWYTKFGLSAVLSDVLVIFLGFLIARYVYTWYFKKDYGWNPSVFAAVLVAVQAIHDVLFYFGVIVPLPKGENAMMDVFKAYAASGGAKIIFGDALLMLGSLSAFWFYSSLPAHVSLFSGAFVSYALTYILYTPPKV